MTQTLSISIKKATKKNLTEILSLQKIAFKPVSIVVNNENIPPMTQTYEDILNEFDKSLFLICLSNNQIIGSVRGSLDKNNHCTIGKLIVHPNFQNLGIGKKLMLEIENYFPSCISYQLFTGIETPNTVYLYKKLGYKETSIQKTDNVSMVYMEKKNKPLNQLSDEELWQLFPIVLSEHNPQWKNQYLTEKENLEHYLGTENIIRINHIGSTSVSGLLAKPTIDILIEIRQETDISSLIKNMENNKYIYSPQPENPAPHMMFMKGYTPNGFKPPVFHVHIRYAGDWNELYFRDYLQNHPETCTEYGNLKHKLKESFEHDRNAYTKAKSEFIQKITLTARKEFPGKYKVI